MSRGRYIYVHGEFDNGDVPTYNQETRRWEASPGGGGGGGSSAGVGDTYGALRSGAADVTTGSFDWANDGFSVGDSIVLDDSTEWAVDVWGYALPKVTAAGLYMVELRTHTNGLGLDGQGDAHALAQLFVGPEGNNGPDTVEAADSAVGGMASARFSRVFHAEAGDHFDVGVALNPDGAGCFRELRIERIA